MTTQKKCSPALRFVGFTDDWEQRKLGDISIFFSGGTPSVNNQNFYNGNIPFIRSGDIHSHDAEIFISQEALEYSSAKLVKKGDILYALYGATSGEVARSQLNGAINQAVLAIIPDKNQDPEFIMQWLARSKKYIIQNYLQGGQGNLSSEIVKKLQISKPKKLEEQTQIGNFFKQLDETIALHKRKLKKQQNSKKFYLEKMFPKENSLFPEIRFPNFTDAWEQRKLLTNIKSIIDFRGRTPKKLGMEWSNKGYLALSALNVKNGYIDPTIDAHFGNDELYEKWMEGNELSQGQVLFTTEAPMGNVAQVPDNKKYILSQRTIAFCVNDTMITDNFLAILLRSPKVFADLEAFSSGGTAKGISQKSLENLIVILPKLLDEQTKIGNFFKQLDETIALHKRKLAKLFILKSAFLTSIFCTRNIQIYSQNPISWEQRKLGIIAERVTRKNSNLESSLPLTISAQYGLIAQTEFFDKRIASTNMARYYLIYNGEFAYNKSYSNGYPWGAIKRLDAYKCGVLSTLYIIFKPTEVISQFLVSYFDTTCWHTEISNIAVEGARNHGLLNIPVIDFFKISIKLPSSKEEQTQIGNFFKQLDETIALHKRKQRKYQQIKQIFLRKMLID